MPNSNREDASSETKGGTTPRGAVGPSNASHPGVRLDSVARGAAIEFDVDGQRMTAYQGETIACAMYANGRSQIRRNRVSGAPRGMFCVMGVCQECMIRDENGFNVRSCVTAVEDGMRLHTLLAGGTEAPPRDEAVQGG